MKKNKVEQSKSNGKFRIAARNVFLTYSQVPEGATKEELLQQLQAKGIPFAHYVIARELHKDGGAHFHVVLIADKKFDVKKADALDLEFREQKFHGNYTKVRFLNASIEYACKEGDYITSMSNIRDGAVISTEQRTVERYQSIGVNPALREYFQENLKNAFGTKGIVQVKQMLKLVDELQQSKAIVPNAVFKVEDFKLPRGLQDWIDSEQKPTLMIVGPSGAGKTQFVFALAAKYGWTLLHVNHIECLHALAPEFNAIFFDDFTFSKMHETQLLALLETEQVKTLRILYGSIRKPANLVQIWALNQQELDKVKPLLLQERFSRRIKLVPVHSDFLQNRNVHINVNVNIQLDRRFEELERMKENERILLGGAPAKVEAEETNFDLHR